jgi:hypothetical protein
MEDEGLLVLDGDQLRQVLHRLAHVDVGVARVVEDTEAPIDPHVDARGLYERLVVGVEDQPADGDLLLDGAVAEDHRSSLFSVLPGTGLRSSARFETTQALLHE